MEIKQVRFFLEIAKRGTFSSAAEELYISQSSLSKQILTLEKELGCDLFDRSKRRISLTEAGQAFYPHAGQIYQAYQALLADLSEYTGSSALSIASIPVIAQYGIAGTIARFSEAHPQVNLALEEREAVEILPALSSCKYDLAFVRDNFLDSAEFECVEFFQDTLVALVCEQHPFAHRETLALAELANENLILLDKGTVVHELSVEVCRKAGFEPRIFYASLRVDSILGMVASNAGIALLMKKVYEYSRQPGICAIPLSETIRSNIVLAWARKKKLSLSARTFVDFMQKR
jgi:LysR family transcriptional regulator, transcription activator of glutamate synthase operon